MNARNWFDVDKEGLAKLIRQKGPAFMLFELVQNALDELGTTCVHIRLTKPPASQFAILEVEDDNPDGFRDLRDAWTLYAESTKKGDPTKRGFMNRGEKLVLACCREASIETTTGGVYFDAKGRRTSTRKCREIGSVFHGEIKLSNVEMEEAANAVARIIVPESVELYYNGVRLVSPKVIATATGALETRTTNGEGEVVRTKRQTMVNIYEPQREEIGWLYEMGIPVVETGDRYDVNVLQKVPLNADRDNVTPSFLRELRRLVLEATVDKLTKDEVREKWVREGAGHPEVKSETFGKVMDLRFGEDRVSVDPSDPEAENIAKARGFTVVPGGAMTGAEWANAKRTEALKPAGQVTPSPKPYSPDGTPLKLMPLSEWTQGMRWFERFAAELCRFLLNGVVPVVQFTNDSGWGFNGTWTRGERVLVVNVGRLGYDFFEHGASAEVIRFLVHEIAHEHGGHLEDGYHKALCVFAGKLVERALREPNFFVGGGS